MSPSLAGIRDRVRAPVERIGIRLSRINHLPTSVRAVLSHFGRGGAMDVGAIRLKARVDDRVEAMVDEAFRPVEMAVAQDMNVDPTAIDFSYQTKLLRPAELTLARLYREAVAAADDGFDPVARVVRPGIWGKLAALGGRESTDRIESEFSRHVRDVEVAERVTELVVAALLDGDMRDAINDGEFGDFRTALQLDDAGRRDVAEIAQATIQAEVTQRFDRFPEGVRTAYDRAVNVSAAHQEQDKQYRELLAAARRDDPDALDTVQSTYRDAGFEDPPEYFSSTDFDLPYLRTQYGRVGVIYEGMIDMYRAAGIAIDDAFERSIVLSIIGAQIWLDDVEDFAADMAAGQLTPVTAEYLLADSEAEAYNRVVSITDQYLDAAREHAVESEASLTAIAIEYIRHSGDPTVLPGADDAKTTHSIDSSSDRGMTGRRGEGSADEPDRTGPVGGH